MAAVSSSEATNRRVIARPGKVREVGWTVGMMVRIAIATIVVIAGDASSRDG